MKKGSLCSGVGGLDAATPGELAWVAETNPAAIKVLEREHVVPNLGDITTPGLHPPSVDVLTSGDPCQSMSAAGRQMASEDERFLWPDVMRIIERVRPDHLFLENVQNLTSVALLKGADDWRGERGSVLALRLDDLWRAGYACRWTVLGACAVGAPHHRHRWFLRARFVGLGAPLAVRVESKCGAPRTGGRNLLPTPTTRDYKGRNQRDDATCLPGAVNLLPSPTTADGSGGPGRSAKRMGGDNLRTAVTLLPTPRATDGVNGGPNQRGSSGDLAMGSAVQPEHWGKFADAVALWEEITGRPAPAPTVPAPRGGRRLNPELSEWMMGYPLGYLTGDLERNEALRCAGNGVVPLQGRAAWELLA
jgi:DNA (cytosine-5)-methyltransferase 1